MAESREPNTIHRTTPKIITCLLISVVLSLVSLELLSRFFFRDPMGLFRRSPSLGYEMVPNFSGRHKKLKDFDYRALAVQLGLDPDRFEADMKSEAAAARIAEDITLAKSLGVGSTPTIFLSGRRVDKKLVPLMAFWQQMGHQFGLLRDQKIRAREEKQRHAQPTTGAATQPTPNTPERSNVP